MSFYINTPCGPIQGTASLKEEGIGIYRGIRYATAKRFCYPVPVTHWDGVYDATRFGACSYQPRAFYDESVSLEKAFYYNEFRKGEHYDYSEDCLFLNIWAPEHAKDLPVLFFIHGGSFTGGCGFEKHLDGEAWCKKGVIVVTINYRLGPFGFMAHPWLTNEAGKSGNYGIYDQLCALQWVYNNIEAFGGNPKRITLMGQSAGAMSVQALILSPLTEGLFCGAIMLSGGGINRIINPGSKRYDASYDFWTKVVNTCGANQLNDLRELPPKQLLDAFLKVKKETKGLVSACSPYRDDYLLTVNGREMLTDGRIRNIPYLTCTTSEDIFPPVFYHMAKGFIDQQAAAGNDHCYGAFFKRRLPGDTNGAWHSSDLWYTFGTLANGWRPFTEEDYSLSDTMISYYSNFAKTGNPNGEDLTFWSADKKGNRKVMLFDIPQVRMGTVSIPGLTKNMLFHKIKTS